MAKSKLKNNDIIENIVVEELNNSLSASFNRYAKAVITDRAVPDVRDGLKPVQRRIIYAMYKKGYFFEKETVKSATVVGEVMGHFHPHGDASIYDAIVRLSQDWKSNVPLITFQGNNGSLDNDPAASSRYTEVKLSAASQFMVSDIDKNTVDMVYTFDDKGFEPIVLPARFPNLLVNGASGIAIGSSTSIPTHNLAEVVDAIIYRINHKNCTIDDLLNIIKGPDFPTGGVIDDIENLREIYKTGSGSFYIHSKAELDYDNNRIVITEIPYGEIKSKMVFDLDEKRIKDKLDNIEEIRDESTEDVKIVIDVKKGASVDAIYNYLISKGLLRTTFPVNMLTIDRGHPKVMNLMNMIDSYISYQQEVITRRSKYLLDKDNARLNILEGLIKAISILEEVIALIRSSSGKADSKNKLIERYGFNEPQAEAIVTLQLYRLSNTDVTILKEEIASINEEITYLFNVLADINKLNRIIISDLKEIVKKIPCERKTQILEEKIKADQIDQTKLIAKEDCYIVLTQDGYIKRTNNASYSKSVNDDPIDSLPKLKDGDIIKLLQKTDTHNSVIAFTSLGNYIYIKNHEIPEIKWKDEGVHLNTLCTLESKERIVAAYIISDFKEGLNVVHLTQENKIKRSALPLFAQTKTTSRPIKCCGLLSNVDRVVSVCITSGDSNLIVVNENGKGSYFNENDIPLVGIKASGVKAMNLGGNICKLVSLISVEKDKEERVLILTDKPCARVYNKDSINFEQRVSGPVTKFISIGKSNKLKIQTLSCIKDHKKEKIKLVVTDKGNLPLDVFSMTPQITDITIKENIFKEHSPIKIKGVHEFSMIIDSNTETKKGKVVEQETSKQPKKEKTNNDQLSLFDDLDELLKD